MFTSPLVMWFLIGFMVGIFMGMFLGNKKFRQAISGMIKRGDDDEFDKEED